MTEKRPIGLRAGLAEHVYGATVETGDPSVCGAEIPLTERNPLGGLNVAEHQSTQGTDLHQESTPDPIEALRSIIDQAAALHRRIAATWSELEQERRAS